MFYCKTNKWFFKISYSIIIKLFDSILSIYSDYVINFIYSRTTPDKLTDNDIFWHSFSLNCFPIFIISELRLINSFILFTSEQVILYCSLHNNHLLHLFFYHFCNIFHPRTTPDKFIEDDTLHRLVGLLLNEKNKIKSDKVKNYINFVLYVRAYCL